MRFFCFSLLILILFSCSNEENNHTKLIHFVPENTSILLKTSNLESLKSSILNNDFLQHLSKTNVYKNLDEQLQNLSLLNPTSSRFDLLFRR